MKKILLMFVAVLTLGTNTTFAQKINMKAINMKINKAQLDVEHPKKGLKASTWIALGDVYLDILLGTTKTLYVGMEQSSVSLFIGAGKAVEDTVVGDKTYSTYVFPYFRLFLDGESKVAAWKVTKQVKPEALAKLREAYAKALEIDPSSMERVKESYDKVINYYKQQGALLLAMKDMQPAADAYATVADLQALYGADAIDPLMLFYAGYIYTIDGEKDSKLYAKGEGLLKRSLAAGYDAYEDAKEDVADKDRGNIYYYLYHSTYGDRENHPEKMQDAKEYLKSGIAKYPLNDRIFEGLIQLYTSNEGMGDPSELLDMIEASIKVDPNSINAWFGRGRVYSAIKNYDECVVSFSKVAEIVPERFDGHFYTGYFMMVKCDEFREEMVAKNYVTQAEYNADIAILNGKYMEIVPHLERAHEIRPTDATTLEYLKQIYFRLRDEEGMMEKYKHYDALLKAL